MLEKSVDKEQYILVADYVPLANKGEEAIIRGIEDILSDGRPVRIGVFDNVDQVKTEGGITVFPIKWIFRIMGNFPLNGFGFRLKNQLIAFQMCMGYYSRMNNLRTKNAKYRSLSDFFDRSETVIVGHDGVFCLESCGIIHLAKKAQKRVGILGSGRGMGSGRGFTSIVFQKAISEVDFCFFREQYSYENSRRICDSDKIQLAPDPAFAMVPDDEESVAAHFEDYPGYANAVKSGKPILSVTVLEQGRVFDDYKPELAIDDRKEVHAKLLAGLFDEIIKERDVYMVFLPHSIEKSFSDISAARRVTGYMKTPNDSYMLLDADLSARTLKSIVKHSDFVIGERTHSLIGSVSVNTPFLGLTTSTDRRTHGIIGKMCDCEDRLANINVMSQDEILKAFFAVYDNKEQIREHLRTVSDDLRSRLNVVAGVIKGK